MTQKNIEVSIIIPVYNADQWLEDCFNSILIQDFLKNVEISVFNDGSCDKSGDILNAWSSKFQKQGFQFILSSHEENPKGVGFAKNQAVIQSSGTYLCFLDADDVMHPTRIMKQYEACFSKTDTIVGCQFHRDPTDSTPRYTRWANILKAEQLYLQIYTAFGPTVVMPTWFCHRQVFQQVGGFDENGKLHYRDTIWNVRLKELETNVLSKWNEFTIWNAGKQGRKFYRTLSSQNKKKVQAFCDVDVKKLSKGVYIYEESIVIPKPRIPIKHFRDAKPPFILCVKVDMTSGSFEENLESLNLKEGRDYFHFS
ncbi:queuosine-tRNA galactosyltransferase isoform X2 [Parasteatoda tepidariorum]|uniref:queuosine-tRNA galactosyltransferase isoform X2 n=1 Tax=Parasteatoda tepidariorum TaxID=114398 RepID=UPI001C71AB9F|nr:UDP-GlcNAc:betaGal beta-1,3-N-acetylglucosaminyltransferase-like protein 1 isoform X3 [Parasteatoda tepidariorum]